MKNNVYHTPVLMNECIDGLNIIPGGLYIDLTYGGGGHSSEILNRLENGKLIAFDQDKDAESKKINDNRLLFIGQNFRFLKNFLRYLDIHKVNGIIADLGVSMHQFETAERGFSFLRKGALDMRMNSSSGCTAFHVVNTYSEKELSDIFFGYGEIRNAKTLTGMIIRYREYKKINSVSDFREAIQNFLPKNNEFKILARIFQALRIEVNQEIEALKEMLLQTPDVIEKNGRLVIITYHSLEDRIVKNFIRHGKIEGEAEKDFYGNMDVPFEAVNKKVIVPDLSEIERNKSSRSAKLRIAVRL